MTIWPPSRPTSLRHRGRPRVRRRAGPVGGWERLGLGIGHETLEPRLALTTDLGIEIGSAHVWYMPGGDVGYTVTVRNLGPTDATGASVTTALATPVAQKAWWTASYSAGGSGPVVGAGNVAATIALPVGGTATFAVVSTADVSATGPLASIATVALAGDPVVTNDAATATLQFAPRPLVVADAAGWTSTSAVRVLDAATGAELSRFFAYEPGFRGGVQTVLFDMDRDGRPEILTAPGRGRSGEIRAFTLDGTELAQYRTRPFGADWRGGVNFDVGNVDGDDSPDLAAAKASGDGEVRVFLGQRGADPVADVAFRTIRPFAATYLGGSTVAFADLGKFAGGVAVADAAPDGREELLIGSGPTRAAEVQVRDLSVASAPLLRTILPFDASFRGGVSVAAARVNPDSVPDVLVTAGRRGFGRVEVHDGWVNPASSGLLAAFAAFATPRFQSAFAAGVDGNGDGVVDEFIVARAGEQARRLAATGVAVGEAGPIAGRLVTAAAATSPAVTTTASGLRYRDLVVGTGPRPSSSSATVTVNYEGRLLDGTRFDGNAGVEFALNRVIAGWTEGLLSMQVGGRRELIIQPSLAYGATARPGIPANSTLVFDVELLDTD